MSKILGGVSIAVSALIILAFLGIYNITSLIGFDIIMIGALLLVATQIFYYFQVHVGGGGRLSSLLVKFVIALPGLLYIFRISVPYIGGYLGIVTAIILFMEGIYTMH